MPIRVGFRRLPTQPYGSHSFFLRYFHTPSLLDRGYNGRCVAQMVAIICLPPKEYELTSQICLFAMTAPNLWDFLVGYR